MSRQQEPEPLLGTSEVADWLNVTSAWVHEMARTGEMPALKLGRYWRFSRPVIEAWLAERAKRVHSRRTGS